MATRIKLKTKEKYYCLTDQSHRPCHYTSLACAFKLKCTGKSLGFLHRVFNTYCYCAVVAQSALTILTFFNERSPRAQTFLIKMDMDLFSPPSTGRSRIYGRGPTGFQTRSIIPCPKKYTHCRPLPLEFPDPPLRVAFQEELYCVMYLQVSSCHSPSPVCTSLRAACARRSETRGTQRRHSSNSSNPRRLEPFFLIFCWTVVHFCGHWLSLFLDFGQLCPLILNSITPSRVW